MMDEEAGSEEERVLSDEEETSRAEGSSQVKRSVLQRERSLKFNKQPDKGKRHERRRGENNPKGISALDRIRQFPNECFESRNGRLYCRACREFISMNNTTVKTHIGTKKHEAGKTREKRSKLKEVSITDALKVHSQQHKVGEMLPTEVQAYRVRVVQDFLRAGIPLRKVDELRDLLESGGHRLTTRSAMSELIPTVRAMEIQKIRADLGLGEPGSPANLANNYSVIFDGTTRQGEAIAIIIRYVNANWEILQRLVKIDIVAKSVTADQLSQVLVECLFTDMQLRGQQVLATMRDGAAVNGAAIRAMQPFLPQVLDVTCFSHTLDNVGQHFITPVLDAFGQAWVRLFSTSHLAKLRWKERTGQAIKSYSKTRWWSWWEVLHQLLLSFGDVQPFLNDNQDVAPKTMDRLRAIMEDDGSLVRLKLELAAVVDVGKHFVAATYDMEGDGALSLCCYSRMQAVCNSCQMNIGAMHFPNLHAVAEDVARDQPDVAPTVAWGEAFGHDAVRNAVHWFLRQFNIQFYGVMRAFKAARLMCPVTVQTLGVTPVSVEQLRAFPFLDNDEIIGSLAGELPLYLAVADGTTIEGENIRDIADQKVQWWRGHERELPFWSAAVKKVLLVQPSSAAAERVFSLLNAAFGHQQDHALRDYLECSVMLQYNHRRT